MRCQTANAFSILNKEYVAIGWMTTHRDRETSIIYSGRATIVLEKWLGFEKAGPL